jgi:hypothetical protein
MQPLAPTPPTAPAPQGPPAVAEGRTERVFWAIYRAPTGSRARFLVVRWRVVPGMHRAICDEPIAASTIKGARAVVPRGLKRTRSRTRGRGSDRLLETWSEAQP